MTIGWNLTGVSGEDGLAGYEPEIGGGFTVKCAVERAIDDRYWRLTIDSMLDLQGLEPWTKGL